MSSTCPYNNHVSVMRSFQQLKPVARGSSTFHVISVIFLVTDKYGFREHLMLISSATHLPCCPTHTLYGSIISVIRSHFQHNLYLDQGAKLWYRDLCRSVNPTQFRVDDVIRQYCESVNSCRVMGIWPLIRKPP